MKRSERRSGGFGPKLFTVKEAAEYLGCCERQLRKEIRERKITYRRPPGGIRFTEDDLLERLEPSGGPSAHSRQSKRGRECPVSPIGNKATSSFEPLKTVFDEALITLGDELRKPSGQTAAVVEILEGYLRGEPCDDVSCLDAEVAKAFGVVVAARTMLGEDADLLIRAVLNTDLD